MKQPGYKGDWNEEKVAIYLLRNIKFKCWYPSKNGPPFWIDADGREIEIMDNDDDRWCATWKFVADRGKVTRPELAAEFAHLIWSADAER